VGEYIWLAALFVCALAFRLNYVLSGPDWPIQFGDGGIYITAAKALLEGRFAEFLYRAQLWGPGFLLLVLPLYGLDQSSFVE
jgi:hypothetical protein